MNAMTEIVPAVPDAIRDAIEDLAIEMRIAAVLAADGIRDGHDYAIEERQAERVVQALSTLRRAAGTQK